MAKAKISSSIRAKVMAWDSYICRACGFGGSENFSFALECDHIIPESMGGKTEFGNLQCLCGACNKNKSDIMVWEFPQRSESVAESVWTVNQKIVRVAFTIGVKEGTIAKTMRRLK